MAVFFEGEREFFEIRQKRLERYSMRSIAKMVGVGERKVVLEQLLERGADDGYIRFDREFNKELLNVARRIVGKE